MKILFVTPPPYLPNRLHRIRTFDLIKMIAKKHKVYLLSATFEKKENKEFAEIKSLCQSVHIIKLSKWESLINCLLSPTLPLEVSFCKSQKVKEEIQKIIKKEGIDLVYLKRLRGAVFLPDVKVPVVLDTTDAMSMFYLRMFENHRFPKNIFYLFEALKYRNYEQKVMDKIKHWIACSDIDRKYLQTLGKNINIHVVPNGVDMEYFQKQKRKCLEKTVLFRGLMDKPVNVDAALFFVNQVFPLINKNIPDVKLYIVGPNPHSSIRKLAKQKNIVVTGFVEDVREYLQKIFVSVCSVRIGTGTRYKILQSWAVGQPVVSTSVGAEGLLCEDGVNIEITDDPKIFAQKIIKLFKDQKHCAKLSQNGYLTVKKEYGLDAVGEKLNKIFYQLQS